MRVMKDGAILEMIAGSLEIWASQVFQKQKSADFFVWLYDKESQSENRWWVSSYKGEEGQGLYTIHT